MAHYKEHLTPEQHKAGWNKGTKFPFFGRYNKIKDRGETSEC